VADKDETLEEELETIDIDDLTPLESPITPPSGLSSHEEKEPIYIEPTKKSRTWIIVLIAIGLIISGGFGAVYLYLHQPQISASAIKTQSAPKTQSSEINAQTIVSDAELVAKGSIKQKLSSAPNSTPYDVFSAPNYEPNGYEFWTRPTVDYGFGSYGTKDLLATDLASIQGVLVQNKLSSTILNNGSSTEAYAAQFESDTVICLVTSPPAGANDQSSVILGCANKNDYISNAAAMLPFFLIFKTANFGTDHASNVVLSGLTVTKSQTDGYTTGSITVGGAGYGSIGSYEALFYVTPDSVIHYFMGSQSEVPCSLYNTDDLKKAYLGNICTDGSNDSATVSL
jgi:hypothetical protein